MKKQFFILLGLLLSMAVYAKQITEEQALIKAQRFMKGRHFIVQESAQRHAAKNPSVSGYYVFNVENQGGFVIVSGDDRAPEILGYAEKGHLDVEKVPCNVRWLLDCYEHAIKNLSQNDARAINRSSRASRASIAPLVLTEWGQGTPYNDLCPNAEGGNCVTGCVATAMAQVINYNRWPQNETNAVDAYVSDSYHISMPQLRPVKFNWDNMTSGDIARLMLYCGQSVKMDYGPGSSGAYDVNVAPAMTDVFGYSKGIQLLWRDNYETEDWEQIIYDELREGRPMVYNGQGPQGGHSFVICGYQDQRFYVNWGWNGDFNGYFDLSILAPGNGTDFSWGQTAVVGIQPPVDAGDINRPKVVVQQMAVSEKALSRTAEGDDFPTVNISSTVISDLTRDTTIQIGLGLYDANGLMQVLANEEYAFSGTSPYTYEAGVTLSGTLKDGDYTIKAVNRIQNSDDWLSDAASSDRYVSLTIDGKDARLQAYPKTGEDKYYIEYGTHTIDSVTYRLVCEYENYRAYVVHFNETEKYVGDIYVPDVVNYSNMPFKVFGTDWNVFGDCQELTSLSIGVRTEVINAPKLRNLEIRQNVTAWGEVRYCDALESVLYPSNISELTPPYSCRNLKEIRFATTRQLRLSMNNDTWSAASMPSLTDVYFSSDCPPEINDISELKPNPNVTIHIPQGTLAYYQHSVFRNWKLAEDQPSRPVSVAWDYSGNDERAYEGIAVGRGNNDVEFAMCVPASHLTAYMGCKVTKIEFYSCSPSVNDWHMADVEYVFLTKPGTDYLAKVPLTTIRGTWNTVELPEPYVITGDQLFVGYGRNKSLEADWANMSVVDEGFYLRVMGSDASWGMDREVGIWQKHAGLNDWNHPLAIRFYIEGDHLPTDVLTGRTEMVNASDEQEVPAPAMALPLQPASISDGYFTLSRDGKGQLLKANKNRANSGKIVTANAVLKRAPNGKMQIKTTVRSRTPHIINVLTIDWTIDNKTLGSQSFETCILPNHQETFYIDLPDNIQGRNHSVKVDVVEIDGEPDAVQANSSDVVSFALPAATHFSRRVVMEEATGTWCGYCPRGIETIKLAAKQYPDNFIAIGLHSGDEMYPTNGTYNNILDFFSSFPSCTVNRTDMMDPSWWDVKNIIERLKDSADADIKATALFTAADSSHVTISTETTFGYSDNGTTEHRIAYVVLEDNVGPYSQTNYYSDPAAADDPDNYMNWWVHQDYEVPMAFNDVARGIYDWKGAEGTVPETVEEGVTYSHDYSLVLPDNIQDKRNIRIVALLIDCNTGEILNAAQTKVEYNPALFSSVRAKNYTRSYGDENPVFEFTVEGSALDGEPVISCEATVASPVGSYLIVVHQGTVKNRFVTYIDGVLTVEKTPLTVSVGNYTREQYQDNPDFLIDYEGWKLGEDESVLKAKPRARTLATFDSPVGEYDIVVSGGLATNYEFHYVNGTLTITEASGITEMTTDHPVDVYTLMGSKVKARTTTLEGLPKGIYIVNGKKVVVRNSAGI